MHKGTGRLYAPDDRDEAYRFSAVRKELKAAKVPKRRVRPYKLGRTLDQAETPHCVGYSMRHKLTAAPFMVKEDAGATGDEIYRGAQDRDEWEGNNYPGTSVRGGAKYLQELGYIKSYVWLTTVEECEEFIRGGYGTLIAGTEWDDGMSRPDAQGFVRPLRRTNEGHAYHIFWCVPDEEEFWFQNSWGDDWGIRLNQRPGCAKIRYNEFFRLLGRRGEICAPTEVKLRVKL